MTLKATEGSISDGRPRRLHCPEGPGDFGALVRSLLRKEPLLTSSADAVEFRVWHSFDWHLEVPGLVSPDSSLRLLNLGGLTPGAQP